MIVPDKSDHIVISTKDICLGSIIWFGVTTFLVLFTNISAWILTPLILDGLFVVIGLLLAINLRINATSTTTYLLYVFGLGLGFSMLGSLGLNSVMPFVGILQPLGKLPLIIFFDLAVIALTTCAYFLNGSHIKSYKIILPNRVSIFLGILPLVFLITIVIGVEKLNNSGTGIITLVTLFCIALYVLVLVCVRRSVQAWVYPLALYTISLSLLLMYSLRTEHILGWDINQEYEVFQATLKHFLWKPSYYPGLDYNACVSITILPTILKVLTNIPSEYVFKVTFQFLFATVPVIVYEIARRYLSRILSFLAGFLYLSQTWFYEQMPALIRQEVAFIFFAALILVLLDRELSRRNQYILLGIFTANIILAHYSTAYVWFALLFIVIIFSYGKQVLKKSLDPNAMPVLILFFSSIALLVLWQAPLTHTAGKILDFASYKSSASIYPIATSTESPVSQDIVLVEGNPSGNSLAINQTKQISPSAASNASQSSPQETDITSVMQNAIKTVLFNGNNPNTNQNIYLAQQFNIINYANKSGFLVFSDSATSNYTPQAVNSVAHVNAKLPTLISSTLNFLSLVCKVLFIDLLPLIGVVGMYFEYRRKPTQETFNFILLSIGAYALLALMLVVPYLQKYYNLTRLYLQMFIVLATLAVFGGSILVKYLPKYRILALSLLAICIFLSSSGAFDELSGGVARITLNQPPSTFDNFVIYDTEIAAAQWLELNRDPLVPVQADTVANLRLQSFANLNADNTAIFPQTLRRDSYVYLTEENLRYKLAFYQFNNNLLIYNLPFLFIDTHKNLIYDDGGSRVYK
jgi:uncharacterized membrane protein